LLKDDVVVGGGIVGLACAYKLRLRDPGRSLVVLEKEDDVGVHQTGHNSGVIHSGIYYKPGSLKARIAVKGASALVRFCEEHGVRYELSGKAIVAVSEVERPALDALLARGRENGVPELRAITPGELSEIEPHTRGVAALFSPRTGVVSFRDVARELRSEIESMGGEVRTNARVVGARREGAQLRILTTAGDFLARRVVTAAGLHSDRIAALLGATPSLRILPFRGEYYRLKPESRQLVRSLVYPVPDPRFPFLGVHFTRGIDGEVEAGPNAVLALAREGYRKTDVNLRDLWELARFPGAWRMARRYFRTGLHEYHRSFSRSVFARSLQKLIPAITEGDLEEGGSGVRAMAVENDGSLIDEFRVVRVGCAVHVLNAPSPAATSALAIADHVVELASE
jgi:L-2-hydroxyglutarate oxidase LhgO